MTWIYVFFLNSVCILYLPTTVSSKQGVSDLRLSQVQGHIRQARSGTGNTLPLSAFRNTATADQSSILDGFLDHAKYTQLMITLAAININDTSSREKCSHHAATYVSDVIQSKLWTLRNLAGTNITTVSVVCHEEIKSGPISNDPASIGAIVLIAVLGSLVLLGTITDMYIRGGNSQSLSAPKSFVTTHNSVCTDVSNDDTQVFHIPSITEKDNDGCSSQASSSNGKVETSMSDNSVDASNLRADGVLPIKRGKESTEEKGSVQKPPLLQRLALCFSAISNGEKILSVKNTPGSLTCLNGIRVLSMGWVILGHTFLMLSGIVENPIGLSNLKKTLGFQIVLNAPLAVDSFFILSGLLVTYLFLKETEKVGGVKIKQMVMYYVHRYWRLTPIYAFVIFIYTCLVRYIVDGPVWDGPIDRQNCEDNWWTNILYINNLYREKQQCLSWGWYLSNDMQFYAVAPLALIPLGFGQRSSHGLMMRLVAVSVIGGFLITSIVFSGYLGHKYNSNLFHNSQDYTLYVYQKPWCRIGTFAIGMGLGYILKVTKCKLRLPIVVGWFLAFVAAGVCTLVTYDENASGRIPWEVGARASHETLSRPLWGLVLSWVILMCCTGHAGIVDWMLSWSWWRPLARLTYGAFLIHPVVIHMDARTARTLVYYTAEYVFNRFLGYVSLSYMLSFLLAVLVEAPLLQMEKILFA